MVPRMSEHAAFIRGVNSGTGRVESSSRRLGHEDAQLAVDAVAQPDLLGRDREHAPAITRPSGAHQGSFGGGRTIMVTHSSERPS